MLLSWGQTKASSTLIISLPITMINISDLQFVAKKPLINDLYHCIVIVFSIIISDLFRIISMMIFSGFYRRN